MRRDQRYPISIPCTLQSASGSVAGRIVNVSRGGAGIETMGTVPENFTLVFDHADISFVLSCETRHARELWDRRKVHAKFADLTLEQRKAVDTLIDALSRTAPQTGRTAIVGALRRALRR